MKISLVDYFFLNVSRLDTKSNTNKPCKQAYWKVPTELVEDEDNERKQKDDSKDNDDLDSKDNDDLKCNCLIDFQESKTIHSSQKLPSFCSVAFFFAFDF